MDKIEIPGFPDTFFRPCWECLKRRQSDSDQDGTEVRLEAKMEDALATIEEDVLATIERLAASLAQMESDIARCVWANQTSLSDTSH
jgi:phage host-nuclease inhibitor protein Gam